MRGGPTNTLCRCIRDCAIPFQSTRLNAPRAHSTFPSGLVMDGCWTTAAFIPTRFLARSYQPRARALPHATPSCAPAHRFAFRLDLILSRRITPATRRTSMRAAITHTVSEVPDAIAGPLGRQKKKPCMLRYRTLLLALSAMLFMALYSCQARIAGDIAFMYSLNTYRLSWRDVKQL